MGISSIRERALGPLTTAMLCSGGPSHALKPSAPAELPNDPTRIEVAPGAGEYSRAGVEFDRVVPIHRQRDGEAQACVLLESIALHTIDGRTPAGIVGGVQRAPYSGPEVVDEVSLHGVDGVLLKRHAVEKVIVVRVERDTGIQLERQRPQGLGEPDLRLDGPAIGPNVQQLTGVVLAKGRGDLQAGSYDEVLLIVGELLQRKRGGSIEVDRETEPWIGQPGDLALSGLASERRGSRDPGKGQHHVEFPGCAPDIHGTGVGEDGAMDLDIAIL